MKKKSLLLISLVLIVVVIILIATNIIDFNELKSKDHEDSEELPPRD